MKVRPVIIWLESPKPGLTKTRMLKRHVHTEKVENVASSIVSHASEFEPDLIILCAHGHEGLHDWMVG